MGFAVTIGGSDYEVENFNIDEAVNSLSADDLSGQVGTISFSIIVPDRDLYPAHPVNVLGVGTLVGQDVRFSDTRRGFTVGTVLTVDGTSPGGLIQVSALTRLGKLNVYNIQTQPFVGALQDAFEYYLSLGGLTSDVLVDPSIADTPVTLPGWNGELWAHLKYLASAYDCDIALVSGVVLLRPTRSRIAVQGFDIDRSFSVGGGTSAQRVEVTQYNYREIVGELVYPPGGWNEEVVVFSVNAGETIEETLELQASVSAIEQPVMQSFVAQDYNASSVYTVVGDDGLDISPDAWTNAGGTLSVSINPDTTSLTLKVRAPAKLPNRDGSTIGVYSIALSADASTSRYSTLRIIGSGVQFNPETVPVPTGVSASETATEVGTTVENPFISTREQMVRAGAWTARQFGGSEMVISGSVTRINPGDDDGIIVLKSYSEVMAMFPGGTYASVISAWGPQSYVEGMEEINSGGDSLYENQAFGNVAGARVWDEESRRWYRIRDASFNQDSISFSATDDLIHDDVQIYRGAGSYEDVQDRLGAYTYRQVDRMGLRLGPVSSSGGDPSWYPSDANYPSITNYPLGVS